VAEQNGLKAKPEALAASSVEERLPTEGEILAYVLDVEARLRTDPTAGRERSAGCSSTARHTMTPLEDGSWQAESALVVGRIVGTSEKPKGRRHSRRWGIGP